MSASVIRAEINKILKRNRVSHLCVKLLVICISIIYFRQILKCALFTIGN